MWVAAGIKKETASQRRVYCSRQSGESRSSDPLCQTPGEAGDSGDGCDIARLLPQGGRGLGAWAPMANSSVSCCPRHTKRVICHESAHARTTQLCHGTYSAPDSHSVSPAHSPHSRPPTHSPPHTPPQTHTLHPLTPPLTPPHTHPTHSLPSFPHTHTLHSLSHSLWVHMCRTRSNRHHSARKHCLVCQASQRS